MAMRKLTDEELILLKNSNSFRERLQRAVTREANYWSIHDGSNMVDTLTNRLKWAKNRYNGVQISLHQAYVNNADISVKAVNILEDMDIELGANQAPLSETDLLAALSNTTWQLLAGKMLDIYAEDINLTIGGN